MLTIHQIKQESWGMKMFKKTFGMTTAAAMCMSTMAYAEPAPAKTRDAVKPAQASPATQPDAAANRDVNERARVKDSKGTAEQRGDRSHQEAELSQRLAACYTLGNNSTINIAKLASEKSQNPEVKEFAQTLIKEHDQFNAQLHKYTEHHANHQKRETTDAAIKIEDRSATDRAEARDAATDKALADRPLKNQPDRIGNVPADRTNSDRVEVRVGYAGNMDSVDEQLFKIEKQACKNSEEMIREELSKLEGAEFDKHFVGMEIAAHMMMSAKLKAAADNVSGDFQQVLKDQEQKVAQHQQAGEQLMKTLKDK